MGGLIGTIVVIGLAVFFLKGFDRISGRGPKQISDGIKKANNPENNEPRIPCPHCAEMILPTAKKCRFCQSTID